MAVYSHSLPALLCTRWMRHPFSVPGAWGPGAGLGLPFSSPLRGREGAPRSPRQVREGCVDSFSCGEQVAPRSGPFCFLYFILKLYLMLLYERGGAERELSQSPLRANVLFIMRLSEISCEVVEEGLKGRGEDRGGERIPNIPYCDSPGPSVCSSHNQASSLGLKA